MGSSHRLPQRVATLYRVLLEAHCVKCHGGEKTKAGLDLTTREALLRGGESGPTFSPEQPAESSLLYRMIAHLKEPGMPHKEDRLPPAAISRSPAGSGLVRRIRGP